MKPPTGQQHLEFKMRSSASTASTTGVKHDCMCVTPTKPKRCKTSKLTKTSCFSLFCQCKRTRRTKTCASSTDLWCLPYQLIERIFSFLHVKDLLSVLRVNTILRNLSQDSRMVWRNLSFADTWPSKSNLSFYQKASKMNNYEATVKLGIAYLYNEGLHHDKDGSKSISNSIIAAELLTYADTLGDSSQQFIWLLYRPPWSIKNCCKAMVYDYMKRKSLKSGSNVGANVLNSIAQIAVIDEDYQTAMYCLKLAKRHNSTINTAYMLWKLKHVIVKVKDSCDNYGMFESVRELRSVVAMGKHIDATFSLINLYSSGEYGGLDNELAAEYARNVMLESKSLNLGRVFSSQSTVTTSMRYILVDWLIEVAGVKKFSSHTLHQSIYMMDAYMSCNKSVQRSTLQLLGVACLVISSRFTSEDVITIWEACWLTDNTYRYQDVVKMMASIITSLKGNLRAVTVLDYMYPICKVANCSPVEISISEYICELLLHHTVLTMYKQSSIAASCVILAKLMNKSELAWSESAVKFTGLLLQDLQRCLLHIHEKCFIEEAPRDYRNIKLESVRGRFSTEIYHHASDVPPISRETLNVALGGDTHRDKWIDSAAKLRPRNQPYLIMSPSRKDIRADNIVLNKEERLQASTPPPCCKHYNDNNNISTNSSHDRDVENEGESFLESDIEDSMDIYDNPAADESLSESINKSEESPHVIAIDLLSPIGAISTHKAGLNNCNRVSPLNIHHYRTRSHTTTTSITPMQPSCINDIQKQTKRHISAVLTNNTIRQCKPRYQ